MNRVIAWFSCGAPSAVAAKLSLEKYGEACRVVYCDTFASEHQDNRRFFDDVQRWLGREIEIIKSSKYESVDDVFAKRRYMSGPFGAICTVEMKKVPREVYQHPNDTHVFGYTMEESDRAEIFEKNNPELSTEWILIDQFKRAKDCYRIIREAGIELPAMYALGFDHNNCIGCVKAQSPGYWNKVRRLFPDIFDRRALQSRLLGVRLAVVKKERIFIDQIDPDDATPDDAVSCGPVCQMNLWPETVTSK